MTPFDRRVRQLSRKGWRNGREHGSQTLEKALSLISVFPEKASSRESLFLMVSLRHRALTVGFVPVLPLTQLQCYWAYFPSAHAVRHLSYASLL